MFNNKSAHLSNKDQSSWGLAAMTAAETGFSKLKNGEWMDYAKEVFGNQVWRYQVEEGVNGTCDGGLRWQIYSFNPAWDTKDMSSNGRFFLLAARLARFTGNQTYAAWADKSFSWAKETGLITDEYHVLDTTLASEECRNLAHGEYSQNIGLITEGAAIMYNIVRSSSNAQLSWN
jgi:mannan endo-1,6-alpha-mannosidase